MHIGHDQLELAIGQLPGTEYTQVVGTTRNALGEIIPCIKTSVLDDDAEFIHFHPTEGGIVPCVKTRIEGPTLTTHALATYELLDASAGEVNPPDNIPSLKVESEMLEGGAIGAVEVTVNPPDNLPSLRIAVGTQVFNLIGGRLVEEVRPPT